MTGHVPSEALTDLLDGIGSSADRAHADSCPSCRERLEEARATLALAEEADVPEPPALYWEALRRNVERRIAEEPQRGVRLRWLVPLVAAGAVLVALAVGLGPDGPSPAVPTLPAWSALPPTDEDEGLEVLAGLAVADDDLAVWDDGRGVAAFLAELSDEETQSLVEGLRRQRGEGDL